MPHLSHDAPQHPSRPPCTVVRTHISSPDPAQQRQSMRLVVLSGALHPCTSMQLRSAPAVEAMCTAQRPQRQPNEPARPCSTSHLPLTTHVPRSSSTWSPAAVPLLTIGQRKIRQLRGLNPQRMHCSPGHAEGLGEPSVRHEDESARLPRHGQDVRGLRVERCLPQDERSAQAGVPQRLPLPQRIPEIVMPDVNLCDNTYALVAQQERPNPDVTRQSEPGRLSFGISLCITDAGCIVQALIHPAIGRS